MYGCLERKWKLGAGPLVTADDSLLVPESEWESIDLRPLVPKVDGAEVILNQGSTSECCPHAYCAAAHLLDAIAGRPFVKYSPAWLYRFCNGGRDAGASLDDVIATANERGLLPADVYETMTAWRTDPPANAPEVAKLRTIKEWWDIPTTKHLVSSLQRRTGPAVIGVRWRGGGGHALCCCGWDRSKGFKIQNSWGSDWGDGGFGWLPESQVARGIDIFGCFAPRDMEAPSPNMVGPKVRK